MLVAKVSFRLCLLSDSMSTQQRFDKAVYAIKNGPPRDSSTEKKLNFYKYYKQATEGDVKGEQPYAISFEARAKWDAWNSVKGLSTEEAQQKYIGLLEADDAQWEQHECLKNYSG